MVNVQHDCFKHKCTLTSSRPQVQERQPTKIRSQTIHHTNDTDFILNIFVLHHYDELQRLLPSQFLGPASIQPPEKRREIRLAGAVVLRSQIAAREKSKGAVRQARATVGSKATPRQGSQKGGGNGGGLNSSTVGEVAQAQAGGDVQVNGPPGISEAHQGSKRQAREEGRVSFISARQRQTKKARLEGAEEHGEVEVTDAEL